MNKSHKGIKKRVKVTAKGKILALGAGRERKLEKKSSPRKNRIKNFTEVSKPNYVRLKKMLGVSNG